jgi:hypothetical protein
MTVNHRSILTLEIKGFFITMVNYRGIFITLAPGGSIVPRCVLPLLLSEKSKNCKKTQQPLTLEKKITTVCESLDFKNFFLYI